MKLSTEQIREKWITFFKTKEHFELPFSSLIPIDDPSLLWINSGVATLKPYFEGKLNPPSTRLTNCQKSIRTNDIENVGFTTRHHTLFEMLGNFSIGDYFKTEAIHYAWEFLTSSKWLNMKKEDLYITVYEKDDKAYDIWVNEIGIDKNRIIKGNKKQNFWEIGAGPSGPNTEIFFDRGEKYDPQKKGLELLEKDIENDRYIEIWNIVFSEFNSDGKGNYSPLPRKNIDTGAGLERLASILQNVPTSFDTDIFQKIIKKIEKLINNNFNYDVDNYFSQESKQSKINTAFKIIADHIRAIVFTIADGVYPSNKNQGYIIRRLIRRSMMYGRKIGLDKPFLYKLVTTVTESMGKYYKYLKPEETKIKEIILSEENKFFKTLIDGEEQLLFFIKTYKKVTPKQAFVLFESFGYPFELISEICNEYNISLNKKEFDKFLELHKENSKNNQKKTNAISKQNNFLLNLNAKSKFIGYSNFETENSKVTHIFKDDKSFNKISKDKCYVILDKTPFYAEKGGQASDKGFIKNKDFICDVLDVQTGINNEYIHYVDLIDGTISLNDSVQCKIDINKRLLTMKNHSGTHILHSAIRQVLGNSANQVGSYNDEKYLRIDISYNTKISNEQIEEINKICISKIKENIKSEAIYCSYDDAINKFKALAFFKDKYDLSKEVRIIKFGDFSTELCGGTHVANSKDIESILITKCSSIGNNTYRFVALTSNNTVNSFLNDAKNNLINLLSEVNKLNKELDNDKYNINIIKTDDVFSLFNFLNKYSEKIAKLKKELVICLENKKSEIELNKLSDFSPTPFKNNIEIINSSFDNISSKIIKKLITHYKNKYKNNIIIVFNDVMTTSKGTLYISISEDLKNKYSCRDIIKVFNQKFNAKGGGNLIQAQCGYNYDVNKINHFIENNFKDLF